MAEVKGCFFPEALCYDVPNHVWYSPRGDGSLRLGITVVGVALAREVIVFTPKRVGRRLEAGRSCAVVESAKWAGPVRIAFDAEILAVNEPLTERAAAVNRDPYGEGWMLVVRPLQAGAEVGLTPGQEVEATYRAWMDEVDYPGCAP